MKRIFLRLKQSLRNERGEITFFACFFVVGIVMLISFLLLYASIRITCINIRNGAKMELNNLSGTIYADTYRSQRETNFEEYLNTLYSSNDYTDMLEATVAGGLDSKIPLSTEDYKVSDISLEFNVEDGRVEYIFYCDVEFYVQMFGHSYPARCPARLLYSIGSCTGNKRHWSGRRGYQVLRDIRAGLRSFRHGAGLSDCSCYRNACDLSSQAALPNRAAPCYPVPAISRLRLLYSDLGPTIFKIGDNAYETQ